MWMDSLRRASEIETEIKRTKHGVIKHNIGILYFYFNSNLNDDILIILDNLTSGLSADLKIKEFIVEFGKVVKELNYFFDAFYAHKPFIIILFNFVALNIHSKIRKVMNKFWNKKWKNLNAGNIIKFISVLHRYKKMLESWGIEDSEFGSWVPALVKTFISELFENCKNIIANILFDLRNNYHIENEKYISKSSQRLEEHINFIFDHYKHVSYANAAELLIDLCSTILMIFLLNIKNFIRTEEFPIEIYIAMINNDYFDVIKKFQKKVHNITDSKIQLKELEIMLDKDFLIKLINDIEKLCFTKMTKYFKNQLRHSFLKEKDFMLFNFPKELNQAVEEFKSKVSFIESKFTKQELKEVYFGLIADTYFTSFIQFAPNLTTEDYFKMIKKVRTESELLEKTMDKEEIECKEKIKFKFRQLMVFIESEDIDEVIVTVINMHIFLKELLEDSNINNLLKVKVFFPASSLEYISEYLKTAIVEFEWKTSMRESVISTFSINPYVLRFTRNLSRLKRKGSRKKETSKRREFY